MDQNTVTLLSTLIGGILTISGGLIASFYVQRWNSKQNSAKNTKDALEKIYLTTEKLVNIFSINIIDAIYSGDGYNSPDNKESAKEDHINAVKDMGYIKMLAALYVPFIEKDLNAYLNQINPLIGDLYQSVTTRRSNKEIQEVYQKLYDTTESFHKSIQIVIKKRGI